MRYELLAVNAAPQLLSAWTIARSPRPKSGRACLAAVERPCRELQLQAPRRSLGPIGLAHAAGDAGASRSVPADNRIRPHSSLGYRPPAPGDYPACRGYPDARRTTHVPVACGLRPDPPVTGGASIRGDLPEHSGSGCNPARRGPMLGPAGADSAVRESHSTAGTDIRPLESCGSDCMPLIRSVN